MRRIVSSRPLLVEGLDGSEIVCHFFDNPLGGYNGMLNPEAILGTWENFQDKRVYDKTITTFGYGDGGGGPTERHGRIL